MALDSKHIIYSLISEPVFSIPLLCLLFNIPISNEIIFIIIYFQILSIFSLQLGKYIPPEYYKGAFVSFLIIIKHENELFFALLAGLITSFVFKYIYKFYQRVNLFLIKIKNLFIANFLSIMIVLILNFILFFFFQNNLIINFLIPVLRKIDMNFINPIMMNLFFKFIYLIFLMPVFRELFKMKMKKNEIMVFISGIVVFILIRMI